LGYLTPRCFFGLAEACTKQVAPRTVPTRCISIGLCENQRIESLGENVAPGNSREPPVSHRLRSGPRSEEIREAIRARAKAAPLQTVGLERLHLTIAYDGRTFAGWQSQPNRNGVQDHIEAALGKVLDRPAKVHGAGRTDAGVHALAQAAHVDVPAKRFPTSTWRVALNANLSSGIRIIGCRRVSSEFHARFSAKGKVYRYRVWNAETFHPLEVGRAWHVPQRLGVDDLMIYAGFFCGRRDFASFAANRGVPPETTVRNLQEIKVRRHGSLVTLEFSGDGFLYRMVRMITGSLVQVALGRKDKDWLLELLHAPGRNKTNHTAPAEGLYLVRVLY
jgi:tRNA pseudouridine38-40 synthase